MIDTIQLFKNYVFVFLKAKMEYRFSFFMDLFAQIFTNSINCICIWILAYQFQNVGGWTFYELLLLYSINLLSFGLGALFFWSPMYSMENLIKQGDFDKMLFRPISPFIYLIISQFDYVFFAHIFLGLFFMMYSIYKLKLIIDILLIFLIIIMVIS